jgi:malate dehydrogenase
MKVTIIGASGTVGAAAAFTIAEEIPLTELLLYSRESSLSRIKGESLDMYDALAAKNIRVALKVTSDMKDISGSDIVVITSGISRTGDMSRKDLAIPNAKIVAKYSKEVAKYAPNSILLIVTNPVDVMTHVAFKASGFDKNKVFGLGNHLDSLRLKAMLARHFDINVSEVHSRVVGEHGENMVPLLSSTAIGGILLKYFRNYNTLDVNKMIDRVKYAGTEVIKRKGATEYGPAYAIYNLVTTIVNDEQKILTVSTFLDGEIEGIKEVCLGVPVKLGRKGIERIIPVEMDEFEKKSFIKASQSVMELTNYVFKEIDI